MIEIRPTVTHALAPRLCYLLERYYRTGGKGRVFPALVHRKHNLADDLYCPWMCHV